MTSWAQVIGVWLVSHSQNSIAFEQPFDERSASIVT